MKEIKTWQERIHKLEGGASDKFVSLDTAMRDEISELRAELDGIRKQEPACPACQAPGLMYECIACSASNYPAAGAQQVAVPQMTCSRSRRSDCALFDTGARPSDEWYKEKIKATLDDNELVGPAVSAVPQPVAVLQEPEIYQNCDTELPCGCNGINRDGGNLLPVGMRIRFTKTLTSGPDEHSPGNLYARAGDGGEITGHGTPEGYWVKWNSWPHAFGASRDEFEPIPPNAELTGAAPNTVNAELLTKLQNIVNAAAPQPPQPLNIPTEVIAFLNGAGPLDGVWFGDDHPTERGKFWWRKHLASVAPKPPQAERVPMTDAELLETLLTVDSETKRLPIGLKLFARAIEAHHGIGDKT